MKHSESKALKVLASELHLLSGVFLSVLESSEVLLPANDPGCNRMHYLPLLVG